MNRIEQAYYSDCPKPCTMVTYDIKTDPFYDFDPEVFGSKGCPEGNGIIYIMFSPTWDISRVDIIADMFYTLTSCIYL